MKLMQQTIFVKVTKFILWCGSNRAVTTEHALTTCIQERLIEGILEDDFESNDVDAAVSLMREFHHNRSYRRHVRDLLKTYDSFFNAVERNEDTVISHLNGTNSAVCV